MRAKKHQGKLGRLTVVGILGAGLLFAGCSSTNEVKKKSSTSFAKSASERSISQPSGGNSFPTAQQVGL